MGRNLLGENSAGTNRSAGIVVIWRSNRIKATLVSKNPQTLNLVLQLEGMRSQPFTLVTTLFCERLYGMNILLLSHSLSFHGFCMVILILLLLLWIKLEAVRFLLPILFWTLKIFFFEQVCKIWVLTKIILHGIIIVLERIILLLV